MADKTPDKIEKPWAVYGWYLGAYNLGKVVKKNMKEDGEITCLWINYSEKQQFPSAAWKPEWVKTFDSPIKAMAYLLVHQMPYDVRFNKKSVLKEFLLRFPSEQANLETLLAQTQPKFTRTTKENRSKPNLSGLFQFFQSKKRKKEIEDSYSIFS